jgi:hypothetical protein
LYSINPDDLKNIKKDDLWKISIAKFVNNFNQKIAFIPSTYMFTMWWQWTLLQNFQFLSNLVDYLGWDSRLINIRWKSINFETFVAEKSEKSFIRIFNIFVIPLILLIIWLVIAFIRNRKRT